LQNKRLDMLDVLRGIAALMVVVYHTTQSASQLSNLNADTGVKFFWPFEIGVYGVAAFFMISGFVISMSLERIQDLSEFARARFFRLYPIFWVAVITTTLWRVQVGGDHISITTFLANLTMLPSLFNEQYVDGVYWSLAIELQFYLMMAVIWQLGYHTRTNFICALWLAITILIKLARNQWPEIQSLEIVWRILLLPYAPFFSLGILAYNIYSKKNKNASRVLFCIALILVFASGNFDRALVSTLTAGLLLMIAHGKTECWNTPIFLVHLGKASYCIYLFHQALGYHALHQMGYVVREFPVFSTTATMLVCMMFGLLMHSYVEKPLAIALRRFKK
jgi:peptidoglycan/LPS O-acetylase OafA/YrhL